jgi:AraC-like DNA-binding protein
VTGCRRHRKNSLPQFTPVYPDFLGDFLGETPWADSRRLLRCNLYNVRRVAAIRLREAKKMMHPNHKSITEIAYATGFSSPEQFSKVCKRILGKSPSKLMAELNNE